MASDRRSPDLKSIWLFSNCTQPELRKIRNCLSPAAVVEGQLLVEEGEMGSYLFVIVSGRALVQRQGRTVAELGPGDHFGELSLLDRQPHSASVVCTTDMDMLILSRRHFEKLLKSVPTISGRMFKSMAARLRTADARSYE